MKRTLTVIFAIFLTACQTTTPPPLSTPVPVSPTQPPSVPTTSPVPPAPSATPVPPTAQPTDTPLPAEATSFPDPNAYTWETVVSGLSNPVNIQDAGDGSGRLFIIEKRGFILILENGQLLPTPFLDINLKVGSQGTEQGLLGLAFHPQYVENGLFFVNYTDNNGNTVIARYKVSSDANVADPNSEVVLLRVNQPFQNHNGGILTFGPDGYLYAGLGDGGSGGDPFGNAQNLNTFLGKILRLDVDSAEPYAIPPGNPFGTEIWDYGLRNPWRFSFDRLTGDLYIGDVGQSSWEEIDYIPAGTPGGLNFGWNYYEGTHPYKGTPPSNVSFTTPVAEYGHDGGKCAVTGGYVYRGSMPEWSGIYFFGDYCTGEVWGMLHTDSGWQNQVLFRTGLNISSFGQDQSGEIYLIGLGGQVLRLAHR